MTILSVLTAPFAFPFDSIELRQGGLMLHHCSCVSGSVAHHVGRQHIDVITTVRGSPWILGLFAILMGTAGGILVAHSSMDVDRIPGFSCIAVGAALFLLTLLLSCQESLIIRSTR
jgi:hypothetical protein